DQARALAGQAPQVEAELAQLNRDYQIIRQKYDAMVTRREAASLGVKLDKSSQLAEFRVVDPPRVSTFPVFPGRWQLSLIAIVLSLCAGIAAVLMAEVLRPTVDEVASLRDLSGRPVLGSVTLLLSADDRRHRRHNGFMFMAAFAVLIALQGLWVAWLLLQLHPEWSLS
ncbi:MAG: GNVR domain-containing protein, partial [Sphingomicrobium sp.]